MALPPLSFVAEVDEVAGPENDVAIIVPALIVFKTFKFFLKVTSPLTVNLLLKETSLLTIRAPPEIVKPVLFEIRIELESISIPQFVFA